MIIFGQQDYAIRLGHYLKKVSPQEKIKILSFPLKSSNPAQYAFDFSYFDKELYNIDKNAKITVAFNVQYREKALEYLKALGFNNMQIYDASMDNELKTKLFKLTFAKEGREFLLIDRKKTVSVYMAKSVVDKPLKNDIQNLSPYIIPIQVGAALTDERITNITDDTGDNISERNRHYSEITALYWIWKNGTADYLGLCHYRRLWKDLDVIADKLQNDFIDAVLPLPTWVDGSVTEGHLKYYTPNVWEIMMNVLKIQSPAYYKAAQKIYNGNLFYASNMFIAKRHILHNLCLWMFPILMETEKIVGDLPDAYFNRYCGFCAEQLITLYFLYNKEKWRIAHADKIFIE